MNMPVIDPFQGDFPEVIEEYLDCGEAKCIAFNRRGSLLAAGCADGGCVIWDFQTRGVAKELRDKDCGSAITSVCWSKDGHLLVSSAMDKFLTLWNVAEGKKMARVTLPYAALYARLQPQVGSAVVCLACPVFSAPILVDFTSGNMYALPISTLSPRTEIVHHSRNKFSDGNIHCSPVAACFNKRGDLIFLGNSKGEILIIDTEARIVQAVFQVPGGAVIRQIVFSKNGRYLLTNSSDRIIRVFEVSLPQAKAAAALEELVNASGDSSATENMKLVGSQCLTFSREFQDAVTHSLWRAACFSGDSLWVVAASANKGDYKIFIWDRCGPLVKILEGPKEGVADLAWHPVKPVVASLGASGVVYLWAKDYTENWSAFAPDFKELEENEEYVEREDEFDMMPDTEKVKPTHIDEDEEVDIMTIEKFPAFSDSDDSHDGLHYLPTTPLPDSPKQQDQSSGSPSKPESSTPSQSDRSPIVDEGKAKTPERSICQISNSLAEEVSPNGRIKRRRKLSEKGAEMQAEKGRKTTQRYGPTTKRKTGLKTVLPAPNRFAANEGGFLDSTLRIKSTSKEDAQDPRGSLEDEVPASCKKNGKKVQRLKLVGSISCSSGSPSLPASEANGLNEANGFDNGRYL